MSNEYLYHVLNHNKYSCLIGADCFSCGENIMAVNCIEGTKIIKIK
jgi:hypothetical protein